MIRFVVVATANRGVVAPAEPLDDANQWRAFSAWRQEQSREIRAGYEVAVLGENAEREMEELCENRMEWSKNSGLRAPKKRISRDRRAAEWWENRAGRVR